LVAVLLQCIVDFTAAPALGQGLTARAWQGVMWSLPYGAALRALSYRMMMYRQEASKLHATAPQSAAAAAGGGGSGSGEPPAVVRARLVDEAGRLCQLLSAAAPSRHTCNSPLCRSLGAVSESFGLVRGRA
jgi:hypothetical protein